MSESENTHKGELPVDKSKVQELLKSKKAETISTSVNIDESELRSLKAAARVVEDLKEDTDEDDSSVEVPVDKRFEPDHPTNKELVDATINTGNDLPEYLLEITESNIDNYHKTILFDTPYAEEITFNNLNLTVKIESISNFAREVMFSALEDKRTKGVITDVSTYLTWVQYYSIATQLVSFNGEVVSRPSYLVTPKDTIHECITDLNKRVQKFVMPMHPTKYSLLITAHRVFETKIAKLATKVLDPNFTLPAGIA